MKIIFALLMAWIAFPLVIGVVWWMRSTSDASYKSPPLKIKYRQPVNYVFIGKLKPQVLPEDVQ